jgi:acetyl-CoA decarbonylase/synthase complex subunit beta
MSDFAIDVGPQYEGETVRKASVQVEFGGPRADGFELVRIKPADEVEDQRIEIVGPDLADLPPGQSAALGLMIDVAGEGLEMDMEPVIERRLHMFVNYMEGVWHMGSRNDIWMRISQDAFNKGFTSLDQFGQILMLLVTAEMDVVDRIAVTFVTDPARVRENMAAAMEVYDARDERIRGMTEEDVAEFYSCIMCQSFAPQHVCVITPERPSICGCISWLDGKAAYKMDQDGPISRVDKGECLDETLGCWSGVNEEVTAKTMGANTEFYLHSAFDKPHTGCGCFQTVLFYIPEVDGFGAVHREHTGITVIGETFSNLAGEVSGGRQIEGMIGVGVDYLRSAKFLRADGGHQRLVWMPQDLLDRVRDNLPDDMLDKIATEQDVADVDGLMVFMQQRSHPWLAA